MQSYEDNEARVYTIELHDVRVAYTIIEPRSEGLFNENTILQEFNKNSAEYNSVNYALLST